MMAHHFRKTLGDPDLYLLLLPFGQLQEMLLNIARALEHVTPSPAKRDLELRTAQVRTAIAAFRHAGVSAHLRRALTAKVVDLEQEALEMVR